MKKWVRGLPARWGLGGVVLGGVWLFISTVAQGELSSPSGGWVSGVTRTFVLIIFPLGVIGYTWGFCERLTLERCSGADGNDQLKKKIHRNVLRQTGNAMVYGAIFGFFIHWHGVFRSFRAWDSEANITANISGVLGYTLLAAPIGVVVGYLSKRNLLRRLSE